MQLITLKSDRIKVSKDLGFQVSVCKTFSVSIQTMWEFLLSETGINIWLGEINIDDFELQRQFVTKAGIEGKLTVFVPDCHLRFKWKLSSWEKPSTVELRVRNSKGRASVIFHHTGFFKIEQQEELRIYWKNIISKMIENLANKND